MFLNRPQQRRAAVLPLLAIVLPVMLIVCLFAINIAYMQLSRSELQIATDAAARAGGRAWSEFQDVDKAKQFAATAAAANTVAGQPLLLDSSPDLGDIQFGNSNRNGNSGRFLFTSVNEADLKTAAITANSLQVLGRRDLNSLGGSVGLLLGGVGGTKEFNPTSTSVCTQIDRDIVLLLDQSGSMLFHQDWPIEYGGAYRGNQKWAKEQIAYYEKQGGYNPKNGRWKNLEWKQKWTEMYAFLIPFEKYLGFTPKEPGEIVPVPPYSRWYAAMQGLNTMLDYLDQTEAEEQIAVITFSHLVKVHFDLTKNYAPIREWSQTHKIGGNTYPGRGLQGCYDLLSTSSQARPIAVKTVLLVGDGSGYVEGVDDAIVALADIDTSIYAMSMFEVNGYELLDDIARRGGGVHYIAPTKEDIITAYSEFAETLHSFLTN